MTIAGLDPHFCLFCFMLLAVTVTGNVYSSSKHPQSGAAVNFPAPESAQLKRNVVNRIFLSVTHQCAVPLQTASWLNDICISISYHTSHICDTKQTHKQMTFLHVSKMLVLVHVLPSWIDTHTHKDSPETTSRHFKDHFLEESSISFCRYQVICSRLSDSALTETRTGQKLLT